MAAPRQFSQRSFETVPGPRSVSMMFFDRPQARLPSGLRYGYQLGRKKPRREVGDLSMNSKTQTLLPRSCKPRSVRMPGSSLHATKLLPSNATT
jgi:hypothetical protein